MSATAVDNDPRRLLRIRAASPLLDVPPSTLRKLCASGEIPGTKVGRGWRLPLWWVEQKLGTPAGSNTS